MSADQETSRRKRKRGIKDDTASTPKPKKIKDSLSAKSENPRSVDARSSNSEISPLPTQNGESSSASIQTDADASSSKTREGRDIKIKSSANEDATASKTTESQKEKVDEPAEETSISNSKDESIGEEDKPSEVSTSKRKKNRKRRERRAKKAKNESSGAISTSRNEAGDKTDIKSSQSKVKFEGNKSLKEPSWYTSGPIGGRFLQNKAIFSKDDKYLIIAIPRAIHIYSTSTSLLVRQLPVDASDIISAYALSAVDSDKLYIATSRGMIISWNWVSGEKLGLWDTETSIWELAVVSQDSETDTLYTYGLLAVEINLPEKTKGEASPAPEQAHANEDLGKEPALQNDEKSAGALVRREKPCITAHQLSNTSRSLQESKRLLITKKRFNSLAAVERGTVIIVASSNSVTIGKLQNSERTSLSSMEYIWRDIPITEPITCFDAQTVDRSKTESKAKRKIPFLNLALGSAKGAIYVYEDLLRKLIDAENRDDEAWSRKELTPRILHWHRESVGGVQWSKDGNYIISGGRETVLVLWQLDTGKRQDLPHLTSAIDGIVVSPSGSSYAVHLSDNSIIVLSTTELKPKANIAGLQNQYAGFSRSARDPVKRVDSLPSGLENESQWLRRTPAIIDPSRPSHLLLAVPTSQPKTETNRCQLPRPYLQTFNISESRHESRQAMTRNNATNFIRGPDATKLDEPNLTHLNISSDGRWLATLEDWVPPMGDVEHLASDTVFAHEERQLRRETYLKFWHWHEKNQVWSLETRIDGPHNSINIPFPCLVFSLEADPNGQNFATLGEDGFIRIWSPKTRLRNGVVVRGATGEGMINWSCRHAIELGTKISEGLETEVGLLPTRGLLTYSSDGSVLAAYQEFPTTNTDHNVIYLINATTGEIRDVIAGLCSSRLFALGFVDRYLVIVTDNITIYDVVTEELLWTYSAQIPTIPFEQKAEAIQLAINHLEGTFAVSLLEVDTPIQDSNEKAQQRSVPRSKIIIFKPKDSKPLYTETIPQLVTALVTAEGSRGYVALDVAAEVRLLMPRADSGIPLVAALATTDESLVLGNEGEEEFEDMDVDGVTEGIVEIPDTQTGDDEVDEEEGDKPVVRPQQLAQIFDMGPSFALPPVKDMFNAVLQLYGRKSKKHVRDVATEI